MKRILDNTRRWALLYGIFAARLNPRGYANLLRFSVRRFAAGRNIPVSVMVALTYRCQCDCVHCAVSSLRSRDQEELSTGEVKGLINDVGRLGSIKVGFTGGEPLLRGDITDIVRHAYAGGLSNSIDTNGVLLDKEMARELKRSGVSNVNVSLDHPDSRRHDRLRRLPGCHDAALRAVENCAEAGIPCVVSTYVTDRSMADGGLKELIRLSKSLRASAVRVLFPIYSGKFHQRRHCLLSETNKDLFFRDVIDGSFVYSESPFYDFLSGRMECSMLKKLSVYVTPYGDVKYCYVSRDSLGNIRNSPLPEILEAGLYFDPVPIVAADCQSCLGGCEN